MNSLIFHTGSEQTRLRHKMARALRRLVLDEAPSKEILHYLGCTPDELRMQLTRQLGGDLILSDLGSFWDLTHLVSPALFDQTDEDDLQLCWSHVNVIGLPAGMARLLPTSFVLDELEVRSNQMDKATTADALRARLQHWTDAYYHYRTPE